MTAPDELSLPDQRRLEVTVRGDVQGVGFRWFVSRAAARMKLVGWVANQPDGSVTIVAEGPERGLDALLELIRRGPPGAEVSDVEARRGPATGRFASFSIRSWGHSGD
jgi:acylphosphatase